MVDPVYKEELMHRFCNVKRGEVGKGGNSKDLYG